ncbi:DUF397 domain-containing protein [Actinophytocola gossypii]|uniref:DUF397 domain-containing protein n=1 Tax=Actinophytocola gossypii TaxID=2812003 RepID=A0ABT2JIX6_9PSEU|nr:DUF397 domain-containing protein [Actinophytocola gossypii]MCT2587832.1 DUF397 domain-containing protein [Actinophytocola gossypii]
MPAPIEFHTAWRKSSFSDEINCLEIAHGDGIVGVRDSKNAGGPVLAFAPGRWALLIDRLG